MAYLVTVLLGLTLTFWALNVPALALKTWAQRDSFATLRRRLDAAPFPDGYFLSSLDRSFVALDAKAGRILIGRGDEEASFLLARVKAIEPFQEGPDDHVRALGLAVTLKGSSAPDYRLTMLAWRTRPGLPADHPGVLHARRLVEDVRQRLETAAAHARARR